MKGAAPNTSCIPAYHLIFPLGMSPFGCLMPLLKVIPSDCSGRGEEQAERSKLQAGANTGRGAWGVGATPCCTPAPGRPPKEVLRPDVQAHNPVKKTPEISIQIIKLKKKK